MLRWLERLADWVWPYPWGSEEARPTDRPLEIPPLDPALQHLEVLLGGRLQQVEEYGRAIDDKLASALTLSSIASGLLIAGTTVVTASGASRLPRPFTTVLIVGGGYLSLQMLAALWWVVSGLGLDRYRVLSRADLTPGSDEPAAEYRQRVAARNLNDVFFNQYTTAQKAQKLALALRAYQNSIWGLGLLAVGLVSTVAGLNSIGVVTSLIRSWGQTMIVEGRSRPSELIALTVIAAVDLVLVATYLRGLWVRTFRN